MSSVVPILLCGRSYFNQSLFKATNGGFYYLSNRPLGGKMRSIYVEFKGKIYDIIPAGVELKDVSVIKERIQKNPARNEER